MKRFVALLCVAAVLCTCFLTGCGSPTENAGPALDPKKPVVIAIWHYYNGPQKMAFDELVKEFNETVGLEKGIVVETVSQGNVSELSGKVLDAANKKVGAADIPEIFAAYADTAYQIDKMGLAADLEQYLTGEEIAAYIPGYIEEGRLGGEKLKIFPIAKSTEVLMLNKTDWERFATATGADTADLATMEGLVKTAEAYYNWTDSLTGTPDDGKAFFGRDAMANYFVIGCRQLGVEIFSVKDGEVDFQFDDAVIKKLWDNYYLPYIKGYFASYGRFRSDDAKTGDIIALVGSTSGAAYFPDHVVKNDTDSYPIDVEVFEAPRFAGSQAYAVQQGAGMVVTKSDERREMASIEFLKWFTDTERNVAFSVESGYMPVKTEANSVDKLESALQQIKDSAVSRNLKACLPVAVGMVQSCKMYTNKAFENGTQARAVLENSLAGRAKADLEAIQKLMSAGASKKEAVAKYDTEENFALWYDSFRKELLATQQ